MRANTLRKPSLFPKEIWIGWISSLAEAYNMVIYSFIAPLLAPLLFKSSPSSLLFSYLLVSVGSLLLYPLGALYYGRMGDSQGRQKICIYSTLGLALATGLMGVIPLETLKNVWIYFLCLIGAQHFFSGGEYQGSILFSLEHSEEKQSRKSGIMSALSCLAALFGLLLAQGLAMIPQKLPRTLWLHLPFLVGAGAGILSYVLKQRCQETPAFHKLAPHRPRESWLSFMREEWRRIMAVVLLLAFFIVSYTFIFIFLPLIGFEKSGGGFSGLFSLSLYGLFLLLSGLLADGIGVERVMRLGLTLFSLAILLLSYLSPSLLLLQLLLTPCACLVIAPLHSWMLQQFVVERRCRGIFTSSAIATSLFSGSTVPLCLLIFQRSHSLRLCLLYPLLLACGAGLSLFWGDAKKTKKFLKIKV